MATDKGLEDVPEGTFISILLLLRTRIACATGQMRCASARWLLPSIPRLKTRPHTFA
jgi:hypothetical protein